MVEQHVTTLQELLLIMLKGGCPKEYLEDKIFSLESKLLRSWRTGFNNSIEHITIVDDVLD